MMVFRVYGMNPNPFRKKYDESLFRFERLNDETFHFYPVPMHDQSSKEWVDEWIAESGTMNHFTHRNHIILSNIITNHFKKTDLTEVWHERFIRDFEKIERNNKQLVDYIYN